MEREGRVEEERKGKERKGKERKGKERKGRTEVLWTMGMQSWYSCPRCVRAEVGEHNTLESDLQNVLGNVFNVLRK